MDIDVYQHCPCHSDKKIKFCCGKDVVNELNDIVNKNKAGQALAALAQLDRAIAKLGPLDCLLTIQTHILISQGELEKARASNDLFMENNPNMSIGFQHASLISLAEGNLEDAIARLQDAMDAIKGDEIPVSVGNAFRMIGLGLLSQGQLVAARAHLQFAKLMKGEEDEELQRLIFETFRMPEASIVLKNDLRVAQPPQDKEWAEKYANIIRAMDRGQFRKGLQFAKHLDKNHPGEPVLLHAIAVLNSYLANMEELTDAWLAYARHESVTGWDAIEAEALAQLFFTEPMTNTFDIVRCTYSVSDFESVSETALGSTRMASLPAMEQDPFGEGPAPRGCFYFLDRDKIADAAELTLDNVSSVCGEVLVYGKQTDREARLEWITTKDDDFDSFKEQLESLFGDQLGKPEEAVLGNTTAVAHTLNWNWHLPDNMTREKHLELLNAKRSKTMLEEWPNLKFAILDGKSPREVAGDETYANAVSALVLHLEQTPDSQKSDQTTASQLRPELGIKPLPVVDPTESELPLSPLRQQFVDVGKLEDQQLLIYHSEAMAIGNIHALRHLVPELLNRDSLADKVPRDVSLSMMAQLTEDDEKAFEYLQEAKKAAKENDRPIGVYLVQEFEMRLSRGMTDKLQALLHRIQAHHMSEPNVEYQLARTLNRFGLLNRNPAAGEPEPEPAAEPQSGGIWTPDQDAPAAQPEADSGESKLWIPGAD